MAGRKEDGSDGGATTIRSSASMWCDKPVCYESPIVQRLTQRLSGLLQTSASNAEAMQLLRYNAGDEYKVHHDFSGPADAGASGGRVYSFVLFLSTPEAGGELHFGDVNVSVPATQGGAVLFPTLMNEDLSLPELLTHHASRPVVSGQKLAAVTWVHMYDWRTPFLEQQCVEEEKPLEPPLMMLPRYLRAREAAGLEAIVSPSLIEKIKSQQAAAQQRQQEAATTARRGHDAPMPT